MKIFLLLLCSIWLFSACDFRYSEHRMEPALTIDENNHDQWLEYLNKQIKSSPRKSENYYRKALILSNKEDDDALQLIRTAISLNPNNMKYRYLMAQLLYQNNQYAAGLKEARLVESYEVSKPGLDQILGALYMKVGELGKSEEYLKKALNRDPLNDKSHLYMGLLLLAKGDTLNAEEAIVKSLDMKYSREAIQALIDVSIFKKNYERAFEYLNQVIQHDSSNQELLVRKADLYQAVGKTDSARMVLNHLVSLDSQRSDYLKRLGQLHYDALRLDSAIFYQNKLLELDQNNTEALLTLARIYDRRGFHSSAVDFYKKILLVDSTFQNAKDELEKLNSKMLYLQRLRRERESMQNIEQIQLKPIAKPQL